MTDKNQAAELLREEKKLVAEIKKGESLLKKLNRNLWMVLVFLLVLASGGLVYFKVSSTEVYIDKALVSAPTIDLSPQVPGTLEELYVKVGDEILANAPVARVGDQLIKSKVAGIVISVKNDIGTIFNPGQPVVSMVDPDELRIVGTLDENKGLDKVSVGQPVSFTVDAFGSKRYVGVVDEVSPTSHQSGVVFNISDQRPTQQFDIKARFSTVDYPELRNGMSAKMTIYVK